MATVVTFEMKPVQTSFRSQNSEPLPLDETPRKDVMLGQSVMHCLVRTDARRLLAEFEWNLIRERTKAGLATARVVSEEPGERQRKRG